MATDVDIDIRGVNVYDGGNVCVRLQEPRRLSQLPPVREAAKEAEQEIRELEQQIRRSAIT